MEKIKIPVTLCINGDKQIVDQWKNSQHFFQANKNEVRKNNSNGKIRKVFNIV